MLTNDFHLDQKSISRLATKGLSLDVLKKQLDEDVELSIELWHAQGLEVIKHEGNYFFATKFLPIEEATFCIVDIETNGSKIEKHQIIELAALKVKNGVIIDTFDSLVHCSSINEHISQITGIRVEDTKDAPALKEVLQKFKLFLGDAIFVAHDVKFDYKFISQSMQKVGLAPLLNRTLCSLALAERTLISYRYALSYLNDTFALHPEATHHRAMSDVITTYELFKISLKNIDTSVKTVEDLIRFTHEAKRLKRPTFDPLKIVEQSS
jgi:DNA polymerase-3 subunit epsilon